MEISRALKSKYVEFLFYFLDAIKRNKIAIIGVVQLNKKRYRFFIQIKTFDRIIVDGF